MAGVAGVGGDFVDGVENAGVEGVAVEDDCTGVEGVEGTGRPAFFCAGVDGARKVGCVCE